MALPPLPRLPALTPAATASLLSQLRARGFARVSLAPPACPPWIGDALRAATRDAASAGEFRFPPIDVDGPVAYTEARRRAFRALFEVATTCFAGLLSSLDGDGGIGRDASLRARRDAFAAAARGADGAGRLFGRDAHEPFAPGQPFAQSFFNLFNYDHGSLNGHRDRGLLTVIYSDAQSKPPSRGEAGRRSALWVKDARGTWRDADRYAAGPDSALVLAGEDLEGTGLAAALGVCAAEHAVRVDPAGPRIARAHFRRDPAAVDGVGGQRASAALILRHKLEEAH